MPAGDPQQLRRADGDPVVRTSDGFLARLHHRLQARLPMWVVCRPPTLEYGPKWVARMHVSLPEPKHTRFVIVHDTLELLHEKLPPNLRRFDRDPNDLPEIVEVWL